VLVVSEHIVQLEIRVRSANAAHRTAPKYSNVPFQPPAAAY
jgi:hypothetical protein